MAVLGDRVIAGGYCTAYPGRLAVLTGPFFFYDDHDVQGLVAALLEGATTFGLTSFKPSSNPMTLSSQGHWSEEG